jgi:3'(2'), 5'-bisphosphate nucleotidase
MWIQGLLFCFVNDEFVFTLFFSPQKALMVAQGQADVYLYPQPGTKRWDSCAPDAILRELGGTMTDRDGKEIVYRNTGDMLNLSLVASIDKNLHRRVIESLKVKNKI